MSRAECTRLRHRIDNLQEAMFHCMCRATQSATWNGVHQGYPFSCDCTREEALKTARAQLSRLEKLHPPRAMRRLRRAHG